MSDFFSQFSSREIKRVTLETLKVTLETLKSYPVDFVFLRGLSRSDTSKFRELVLSIRQHRAIRTMSNIDETEKTAKAEAEFQRGEDYLLMRTLSNEDGELKFSKSEDLKNWLDVVPNSVVNEILYHVEKMNTLDGSCPQKSRELAESEQKKK